MVEGQCGEITQGVSLAEAMTFAIDSINSNPNLPPNISLGYDIRDCSGDNTPIAYRSKHMHQDLARSIRSNLNSSSIFFPSCPPTVSRSLRTVRAFALSERIQNK